MLNPRGFGINKCWGRFCTCNKSSMFTLHTTVDYGLVCICIYVKCTANVEVIFGKVL